jgi:8-oxo-dGTP pyrophosphatase MutT (NUDIX family)
MMRAHGPWVIEARTEKYQSESVLLEEDRVKKPDGSPGTYPTVTLRPGVAVLPLDADWQVHLTTQFRYAVGRQSVELPSGTLEDGEEPLAGAAREIQEELGIQADEWSALAGVDVDTSVVRCPVHFFVAQRLRFTERNPDPTERIRPLQISFDAAIEMVMNGQISHAPSCVLILKGDRWLRSR